MSPSTVSGENPTEAQPALATAGTNSWLTSEVSPFPWLWPWHIPFLSMNCSPAKELRGPLPLSQKGKRFESSPEFSSQSTAERQQEETASHLNVARPQAALCPLVGHQPLLPAGAPVLTKHVGPRCSEAG